MYREPEKVKMGDNIELHVNYLYIISAMKRDFSRL